MLIGAHKEEKTKTLLVIDDEELNFFALAEMLKTRGYRCLSAANPAEAFTVLQSETSIAAILVDIMMPGMDGYEATRTFKSHPQWNRIPVIVLTALTTNEDKHKAIAVGADAFLTKPVDVDRLLSLLKEHAYEN
jgi:CheY-like chemotaxis protein